MNNGDMPATAIYDKQGFAKRAADFDSQQRAIGLTKREHFAAMAMQGYLASRTSMTAIHAASFAVLVADQLLKKLEETK